MIDADFERAMNGGRIKQLQARIRHHEYGRGKLARVILFDCAPCGLISLNDGGFKRRSTGRPDPIGQGEVW